MATTVYTEQQIFDSAIGTFALPFHLQT